MDENTRYYREYAAEFFENTVGVDMAEIRARFSALLPPGARILDAGCGSGRDAKAFVLGPPKRPCAWKPLGEHCN